MPQKRGAFESDNCSASRGPSVLTRANGGRRAARTRARGGARTRRRLVLEGARSSPRARARVGADELKTAARGRVDAPASSSETIARLPETRVTMRGLGRFGRARSSGRSRRGREVELMPPPRVAPRRAGASGSRGAGCARRGRTEDGVNLGASKRRHRARHGARAAAACATKILDARVEV